MKKIPLTQGKFALVDEEDFDYLNQWKWYACANKKTIYAMRNIRSMDGKKTLISMHRLVLKTPDNMVTDHKDGNGLNNQKQNLRACTVKQNNRNVAPTKSNTSGYKGVHLNKGRNKWEAAIWIQNKNIYLGIFSNKIDAARAYNEAAKKYQGEFARLNIV